MMLTSTGASDDVAPIVCGSGGAAGLGSTSWAFACAASSQEARTIRCRRDTSFPAVGARQPSALMIAVLARSCAQRWRYSRRRLPATASGACLLEALLGSTRSGVTIVR